MPITASTATVVTPDPQPKTYDKWYITSFVIDSPDSSLARAQATLKKYREVSDGIEYSPTDPAVNIVIDNVYDVLAKNDPTDPEYAAVAQVFGALIGGMQAYGQIKGLL